MSRVKDMFILAAALLSIAVVWVASMLLIVAIYGGLLGGIAFVCYAVFKFASKVIA